MAHNRDYAKLSGWRIRIRLPTVDVNPAPFATESMHVSYQRIHPSFSEKQLLPRNQLRTAMQLLEEVTGEDVRFDFENCIFETTHEQPRAWHTLASFVRDLRFIFCRGGLNDGSNSSVVPGGVGWCRDDQDKEWKLRNTQNLVLDDVLTDIELIRVDSQYADIINIVGAPVTWANESTL
jgi:hypothetical protein